MKEYHKICLNAIYSDGTADYRFPMEPERFSDVTLTVRTARDNASEVFLLWGENRLPMSRVRSSGRFDYYAVTVNAGEAYTSYCFEIHLGDELVFYNKIECSDTREPYYDFQIMPGYKTPDWAKGAVFYQIFTDRFFNGDSSNDVLDNEYVYIGKHVTAVKNWNKYPAAEEIREFYGGDLCGVIKKLDYLKELGIEAIYFNPLFVSPSNHKYDIQDYEHIDPHFGEIIMDYGGLLETDDFNNTHAGKYISRVTRADNLNASDRLFSQLVNEAHARGIKVILDGVFNHCGSFHKWMDHEHIYEKNGSYEAGAYCKKESPYNGYFRFESDSWPDNESYDGWWGHKTLPKLNYEDSPELVDEILSIARKWVSAPFGADGWRLDVAADLGYSREYNHSFWKRFYNAVKEANPDAIILAEHYGDPGEWLLSGEWDSVMNYDAFMEPVTWFLTGMEKHSDEYREDLLGNSEVFFRAMQHHMSRYNSQSLLVAMNELSNHDHSRFLTRTSRKVGRTESVGPEAADEGIRPEIMRAAIVMQMTLPGAPTVYYGDEAGVCGWTDPDSRRTYPWGSEDTGLLEFYRRLIYIHKESRILKCGSYKQLYSDNGIIGYGRFLESGALAVIVNSREAAACINVPVWEINVPDSTVMDRLVLTDRDGYSFDNAAYEVKDGRLAIEMPAFSACILRCQS